MNKGLIIQYDPDDGVDVGDVDVTVTVHIKVSLPIGHQDGIDDDIDIGDIHHTVIVHVARDATHADANDGLEAFPLVGFLIGLDSIFMDIECSFIENVIIKAVIG